jgi:dynein heavy chain
VDKFKGRCETFDKENLQPEAIAAVQPYLANPEFDPEKVTFKSKAAGGLCGWVVNILAFWNVFKVN